MFGPHHRPLPDCLTPSGGDATMNDLMEAVCAARDQAVRLQGPRLTAQLARPYADAATADDLLAARRQDEADPTWPRWVGDDRSSEERLAPMPPWVRRV
jgi:hypothetical protein